MGEQRTISAIFKIRSDTSSNWSTINPVLLNGEVGYDTTNKKFKVGDGSTNWSNLSYVNNDNLHKGTSTSNQTETAYGRKTFANGITLSGSGDNNALILNEGARINGPSNRTVFGFNSDNTGFLMNHPNYKLILRGSTTRPYYITSGSAVDSSTETLALYSDLANLVDNTSLSTTLAGYVQKVSSTDNAIARYDGTDGTLQNSKVTIADSGSITIGGTWTDTSANNPFLSMGGYAKLTGNTSGAFTFAPNNVPSFLANTTEFRPISSTANAVDLGSSSYGFRYGYFSTGIQTAQIYTTGSNIQRISAFHAGTASSSTTYTYTLPNATGTIALTSDSHIKSASVSDKTLTLTKEDDSAVTFSDTDTWRAIKVAGTEKIASSSNTALDFLNTGNVQFSYSNGLIANVSGSVGNADTVDDLHMLDQTYAYTQKLTITVGCVDSVVNTGLTETQIFALTGNIYGKLYLASDTGKYWRRKNTQTTASSANWRDDTTACTNSKALANQLTTEDAIYIKLDTKTSYYSRLPKFFVEAGYDNISGTTQITGFCRQQNQFEFTSCSYNGNNLIGIYQPTANTNIYYLKFTKYRSTYGAAASYDVAPVIYTNFNTNDAELTYIGKNHADYATVSGYNYVLNVAYGIKGTAIYYDMLPQANNTYSLGSSSYKWKNLYVAGNISDGSNSITVANIAKKDDIKNSTITIKQNGVADQTFTLNQSSGATITLVDTTYESKSAASGGTAVSLVTTGEKYTWNNKVSGSSLTSNKIVVGNGTNNIKVSDYTVNELKEIAEGKTASYVIATKDCITGTEYTNGNFDNVSAILTASSGGTSLDLSAMNVGDNIYVMEVDVPDYWVASKTTSNGITTLSLSKLETTKVDLANYVTTDTDQTISGEKDFSVRPTLTVERLPSAYQEVEYVQTDGSAYVDTGLPVHMNYKYKVVLQKTTASGQRIWGSFNQASYNGGLNASITYSSGESVRWTVSGDPNQQVVITTNNLYDLNKHTYIIDNGEVYYDNVDKGKSSGHSDSGVSNCNAFLGTINPGGTTPNTNFVGKIYSYQVWDNNGNLVQDFVPCVRTSDDKVGFYDLIEEDFIQPIAGTFTAGGNVENSEFLVFSDLSDVAVSGDYNDLSNKPALFSGNYNDLSNKPSLSGSGVLSGGGSLTGSQTITHNEVLGTAESTAGVYKITLDKYGHVASKTAASASDVGAQASNSILTAIAGLSTSSTGLIKLTNGAASLDTTAYITTNDLADVATTGEYSDLVGAPTDTGDFTNNAGFITSSALSGYVLSSSLATVATSGSYNDLSNKPTIPTVNNATLTIKQNNTPVGTFTANASTASDINIETPQIERYI